MLFKRVLFAPPLCILSVCIGFNNAVWADIAGRVSFVQGQASVINNNSTRSIFKGDIIHTGEKIETQKDATVQIKMIDESIIALHPNSLFKILEYHFNKDTQQSNNATLALLRGQLRTISGIIAQKPNNYCLITPISILQAYDADYSSSLDENELIVSISRGSVSVGNAQFNAGETFSASKDGLAALSTNTISLSSLNEKLIIQPKIFINNTLSKDKTRPRLEDFSSYNDFLQAIYVYKKTIEETKTPKIIINNLPDGQTAFEYSTIDGIHEIINWGEDITQILPPSKPPLTSPNNLQAKIHLKMNLLNINEMQQTSVDDALHKPQFVLMDIVDLDDTKLSQLLNWDKYDSFEDKKKTDELLRRLAKKGIKTDALGTDISIIGTEIGQPDIKVISRP